MSMGSRGWKLKRLSDKAAPVSDGRKLEHLPIHRAVRRERSRAKGPQGTNSSWDMETRETTDEQKRNQHLSLSLNFKCLVMVRAVRPVFIEADLLGCDGVSLPYVRRRGLLGPAERKGPSFRAINANKSYPSPHPSPNTSTQTAHIYSGCNGCTPSSYAGPKGR